MVVVRPDEPRRDTDLTMVKELVMIFLQVFLAIVAAFFVMRLLVWRRFRRHGGGPWGRHARGRGWRWWRLYRDLHLSRQQRDSLRSLMGELRSGAGDLRGDLPDALARLLGADTFDRLTAERLADERVARLVRLKDQAIDALERAHALLTPEQRARMAAA